MLPIRIRTDAPLRRMPWMNWLLIVANFAVFFAQMRYPALQTRNMLGSRAPDLSQFVTYAFFHIGWGHLLMNMLVLYVLGNAVNDRLGHIGYLGFYLGGAVFAGIGFLMGGGLAVVGASGAVGAVMGAHLALLPRTHITLFVLVGVLEVPGMYFVLIYFLYNVVMSLASAPGLQPVAYETHVAGMLFGFLVGMALLWVHLVPRQPFDFVGIVQRWWRRRAYRQLVSEGYDPFGWTPPPARTRSLPDGDGSAGGSDALRIQVVKAQVSQAIAQRRLREAAALYLELKALDASQCLSRQNQLDVANQLASEQLYAEAAEAYERFLSSYPAFEQVEQVQLMLGLIYARYLERPARARECLAAALTKLPTGPEAELARAELENVERNLPARGQ